MLPLTLELSLHISTPSDRMCWSLHRIPAVVFVAILSNYLQMQRKRRGRESCITVVLSGLTMRAARWIGFDKERVFVELYPWHQLLLHTMVLYCLLFLYPQAKGEVCKWSSAAVNRCSRMQKGDGRRGDFGSRYYYFMDGGWWYLPNFAGW